MDEKELALYKAAEALKRCIGVFKYLAEKGRYPEPLMQQNGGEGWMFAIEAQKKCEDLCKK